MKDRRSAFLGAKAALSGLFAVLFFPSTWQIQQTFSSPGFLSSPRRSPLHGRQGAHCRAMGRAGAPARFSNAQGFRRLLLYRVFFNLFALGTLGGDAGGSTWRAEIQAGRGKPPPWRWFPIVADRAIGLAVLVWIGAAARCVSGYAALFLGGSLRDVYHRRRSDPNMTFPSPTADREIRHRWNEAARSGSAYWPGRGSSRERALSLVFHLIQIGIRFSLADALAFEPPERRRIFPLADIFAMLPVSISGIGPRGQLCIFLGKLGVGPGAGRRLRGAVAGDCGCQRPAGGMLCPHRRAPQSESD
jgi:hypothetical protein